MFRNGKVVAVFAYPPVQLWIYMADGYTELPQEQQARRRTSVNNDQATIYKRVEVNGDAELSPVWIGYIRGSSR